MDRSAKFWDKIAERYAKRPVADEAAYQRKLQVTREYFRPDMEVLEFGCGTGSTAIAHAPYLKHIRAIDISSKMIAIAKAKAAAQDIDNVSFEQMGIAEISVPGQTFDADDGCERLGASVGNIKRLAAIFPVHHRNVDGGWGSW